MKKGAHSVSAKKRQLEVREGGLKQKAKGAAAEEPKAKKAKKVAVTTNEIDDIFASSKKKKVEEEEEELVDKEEEETKGKAGKVAKKAKKVAAAAAGSEKKKVPMARSKKIAAPKSNLDDLLDPNAVKKSRKYVDGLPVYTYEELGISAESGGTPLCPFDCDCCH